LKIGVGDANFEEINFLKQMVRRKELDLILLKSNVEGE
jgi:hypothetical protein